MTLFKLLINWAEDSVQIPMFALGVHILRRVLLKMDSF
jgi:hypothetical protein